MSSPLYDSNWICELPGQRAVSDPELLPAPSYVTEGPERQSDKPDILIGFGDKGHPLARLMFERRGLVTNISLKILPPLEGHEVGFLIGAAMRDVKVVDEKSGGGVSVFRYNPPAGEPGYTEQFLSQGFAANRSTPALSLIVRRSWPRDEDAA